MYGWGCVFVLAMDATRFRLVMNGKTWAISVAHVIINGPFVSYSVSTYKCKLMSPS